MSMTENRRFSGTFKKFRQPVEFLQELASDSGVSYDDCKKVFNSLMRLFILTLALKGVFQVAGICSVKFTRSTFTHRNPHQRSRDGRIISRSEKKDNTKIEMKFSPEMDRKIISLIMKLSERN